MNETAVFFLYYSIEIYSYHGLNQHSRRGKPPSPTLLKIASKEY